MASFAELTTMREALIASRAEGVRRVRNANGSEVEYRSDAEMARAIASLDAQIRAAHSQPAHTIHFQTDKGV